MLVGVDVGGTFTDVVCIVDGEVHAVKVPGDPDRPHESVLTGARRVGAGASQVFNHASTTGLNAILTRRLPKVGFLATAGHRDILDMGRAFRPLEAQTDPHWRRSFGDASSPLVPRYLRRGIVERVTSSGDVLIELDEAQARAELELLLRCDVRGVAICLLSAYINPVHERRLQQLVAEVLGSDLPCSISSSVAPIAKEYWRASTTVVDVLMKAIYSDYTRRLGDGLAEIGFAGHLNFADCAARLLPVDAAMEKPHQVLFGGPAAGTASAAYLGQSIEDTNLLCCDVGGTSSDIALVTTGLPVVNTTFEVEHDLLVNTLTTDVTSIGAGGGSLVRITPTGELQVGPGSAGANPGPACYGRGGTRPTVTDACLLIGFLRPDAFLGGEMSLDPDLALAAFESLQTTLPVHERIRYAYRMALNNIAEGLVDVTVRHGVDPRDYSLVAYGSAGPLLVPPVLEEVGARRVIVPPNPGVFSAIGLLSSNLVFSATHTRYTELNGSTIDEIDNIYRAIENEVGALADSRDMTIRRTFDGRLAGQTWETPLVPAPSGKLDEISVSRMVMAFHDAYEARWGQRFQEFPVVGVTYRVEAVVEAEKVQYEPSPPASGTAKPVAVTELRYLGREVHAGEYRRESLPPGTQVVGPAIIREPASTTQVCEGQVARVGALGEIVIGINEANA